MAKKSPQLKYKFKYNNLCTPAYLYFILSLIGFLALAFQNMDGNDDILCVGNYRCNVGNRLVIFILNVIYIIFWTFLLDMMCKNGYSELSWFILLIPFMLFFLFLGIIMFQTKEISIVKQQEAFTEKSKCNGSM